MKCYRPAFRMYRMFLGPALWAIWFERAPR